MLVTEAQRQKHLYEVPADPCACLLGSFAGETLTGLFVFLILEKDRYVQMLAGLTRSRKACAEALDFLTSRCAGYGADFVFNPRNAVLHALLKERGCIMDLEQLRLRWTREVPVSDLSGIFPLEEPHRARYCALHSRGVYWTAERVLAAPERFHVLLALDGRFLGHIDIADTVKPDAKQAIGRMKAQGLRTAMLTGDGQASADAVAQSVGIDEVHARLLPQDKLAALNEIREKNGAVMFVGDGINDAPVLAGADVGAAMGSGADAAIEAADVVFMKADLSSVPTSVKIARSADIVSKENIIFALAVKLLVMVLGLVGIASMWLAVFADTGVAMLCVLNSVRMLYKKID